MDWSVWAVQSGAIATKNGWDNTEAAFRLRTCLSWEGPELVEHVSIVLNTMKYP